MGISEDKFPLYRYSNTFPFLQEMIIYLYMSPLYLNSKLFLYSIFKRRVRNWNHVNYAQRRVRKSDINALLMFLFMQFIFKNFIQTDMLCNIYFRKKNLYFFSEFVLHRSQHLREVGKIRNRKIDLWKSFRSSTGSKIEKS